MRNHGWCWRLGAAEKWLSESIYKQVNWYLWGRCEGCLCGDCYRKVIWLQRRGTNYPAWWRWRAAVTRGSERLWRFTSAAFEKQFDHTMPVGQMLVCIESSDVPAARSWAERRVVDCYFGQTVWDNLCERTDRFHFELSQRSDFSSKASESNSASAFPFHLQVKLFKKVCESAQRAEPGWWGGLGAGSRCLDSAHTCSQIGPWRF